MHWPIPLILLCLAGLPAAHHDHGPKFVGGRRLLSNMKQKKLPWTNKIAESQMPHVLEEVARIDTRDNAEVVNIRDNTSGKCGPGRGTCAAGYCCSVEGSVM